MLLTAAIILITGGSSVMFIFYPVAGAFGLFLAGSALYVVGLILAAISESRRIRNMSQADDTDQP